MAKSLGSAAEALQQLSQHTDHYVRIEGQADRLNSVLIQNRWKGYDNLFALQGAERRLYIERHRPHPKSDVPVPFVYEGRLVPLDERPYASALRNGVDEKNLENRWVLLADQRPQHALFAFILCIVATSLVIMNLVLLKRRLRSEARR
jgi:hypothetical protein